jgi:photosystem II stability/assembly factor-like uncharacterized protein
MTESAPKASWRFRQTATTSRLIVVKVVSEKVIWACGGGAVPEDGAVVLSVDGGKKWKNVTPPKAKSQLFRTIKAFDADHVVVMTAGPAARIYRTVNGGDDWRVTFANTDPNAFYDGGTFFDKRRGIAVSDTVGAAMPIQFTEDGGKTWKPLPPGAVPDGLPGEGPFATGTSIVSTSKRKAVFTTTSPDGNPRAFLTDTGGTSWTVVDTAIPRAGLRSISFRDRHDGIGVGGTPPAEGTPGDGISARTDDGGRTWRATGAPTGFRNGVTWISGDMAVAVGAPGSDLTTNAGESWTRFDDTLLPGIDCLRGRVCWAVGEGGVAARLVIKK